MGSSRLVCCATTAIEKSWRTSATSSAIAASTVPANAPMMAFEALRINRRSRVRPAAIEAPVA